MDREAALVATSCVLFVQMGLSGAIQDAIRIRSRLLSCPKCLTFWAVLAWELAHHAGLVSAVAVSFVLSYAALWAALILDGLAVLYNTLYETITETNTGASPDAQAGAGPADQDPAPDPDEVPPM